MRGEEAADRLADAGREDEEGLQLARRAEVLQRIPQQDLRTSGELQAFFISPIGKIGGLFSTHPPMEKRIAALQRLEAQLQGRA